MSTTYENWLHKLFFKKSTVLSTYGELKPGDFLISIDNPSHTRVVEQVNHVKDARDDYIVIRASYIGFLSGKQSDYAYPRNLQCMVAETINYKD